MNQKQARKQRIELASLRTRKKKTPRKSKKRKKTQKE